MIAGKYAAVHTQYDIPEFEPMHSILLDVQVNRIILYDECVSE